ncbi:MAG: hypothetical protein Q8K87_06095 [Hydrogenophaga sp.]|jgi:hypothetical protein|uniref:hypothetical protein n=1 Tax=Hydrogenophaga sp. TaxID=1904254 RepID=UPI002728A23D|nr:hypothetical protein [Hydrogenophaga sp.]MDO9200601.1 hypothetical protein [Hydrogenophaga sp.]MDO9479603.1 hypothetical protein [Hydrogenophaga sp.]MDO9568160.1 hypothetical protein [Hydrogenophaga sp.]MDP1893690.1 hypothetical protein [Hydrogenophaga sp.]MDP2094822.1 hypothetical protein [Hydrogenophaga sp.]
MRSHVTVIWGEPFTYRFDLEEVQPMPHDMARSWLDEQFTFLGCEPIRATGKVLTADKVLCVAQAAGEARFRDEAHHAWAVAFAKAASAALAKPVVSVDVQAMTLSY